MSSHTNALIQNATRGHLDAVKRLVESGSDVNSRDKYGWTVLMRASDNGYIDVVKYLVEAGADVNSRDTEGCTALTWATVSSHIDVVKYLVEAGADAGVTTVRGYTLLMLAVDNPEVFEFLESLSASQLRGSVVHAVPGDYTCPICRCHDGEEVFQLSSCVHQFHTGCITTWCKRVPTCPMCRAAI
jgi:hypothetical protein